jgi:outer membrane protein TolC
MSPLLLGVLLAGVADSPASVDPRAALLGSVPSGPTTPGTLALSLADAIQRGLDNNLGALVADQGVAAARGQRWEALSDLLPHVSAHLTATRQKISLDAFGFSGFPGLPVLIGPFNVVDARGAVTQTLFDQKAIEKEKAERERVTAARHSYDDVRDMVVLVCGNLYLQALAEESRIEAAQAEFTTARALHALAVDRKAAGMVPAIDVLRAEVEMRSREQQLIAAENRRARAHLSLARAIGLPLGQDFRLTDHMAAAPPPALDLEQALQKAYASRSDWKSAQAQLRSAEAMRRSAAGEAYPTLDVNADYGAIGQTLGGARATYTLGAALRVPLFEGGKVHGKVLQAEAALAVQRARLEDLRGRIDYEVRTAAFDLQSALDRVHVTDDALQVAKQALTQAEDRFEAGVTSNIEVVQAQQAVADSSESEIAAVYDLAVAKAAMARALGVAAEAWKELVRGD